VVPRDPCPAGRDREGVREAIAAETTRTRPERAVTARLDGPARDALGHALDVEPIALEAPSDPLAELVCARAGVATPYAMNHLQARGEFFISPGVEVYEGMIVGEHNRPSDADCNLIKEKKQTNVRNHGKDDNVMLAVPRTLNIETAMEWIDADELVEVTPDAVRVRKQILSINKRPRRSEAIEEAGSRGISNVPAAMED